MLQGVYDDPLLPGLLKTVDLSKDQEEKIADALISSIQYKEPNRKKIHLLKAFLSRNRSSKPRIIKALLSNIGYLMGSCEGRNFDFTLLGEDRNKFVEKCGEFL